MYIYIYIYIYILYIYIYYILYIKGERSREIENVSIKT